MWTRVADDDLNLLFAMEFILGEFADDVPSFAIDQERGIARRAEPNAADVKAVVTKETQAQVRLVLANDIRLDFHVLKHPARPFVGAATGL